MADDMTQPFTVSHRTVGEARPVPGPKSKEIFAREAEIMAPGLQSIALFSQIAVDHAKGCTITDADGAEYLDFVAGICVGSLGHAHPKYTAILTDQIAKATFGSFTTENRLKFMELVRSILPMGLTHLQMFSGGAEAVEAALRLAKSATKKYEFIGFWGGFHGKTAGVAGFLASTSNQNLGPGAPGLSMSPYANCYRCPFNLQHPSCGMACVEHLRNSIKHGTRKEIAAILIEPMQGTAGNVIPPDDFLPAVKSVAHEFGALLIVDEVLTGFGRTGKMFASNHSGVVGDVMTVGKGIGGGFPMSGVAASKELMSVLPFGEPSGSSSSYGGNPMAAAAGRGAIEVMLEEDLVGNSARVGAVLLKACQGLMEKYRFIGDVRGRGLMIGVEMVKDRTTKEPLDKPITRALFDACLKRGLVTMSYSNVIRINPPLVITEAEALQGVAILDEAMAEIVERFSLQ